LCGMAVLYFSLCEKFTKTLDSLDRFWGLWCCVGKRSQCTA